MFWYLINRPHVTTNRRSCSILRIDCRYLNLYIIRARVIKLNTEYSINLAVIKSSGIAEILRSHVRRRKAGYNMARRKKFPINNLPCPLASSGALNIIQESTYWLVLAWHSPSLKHSPQGSDQQLVFCPPVPFHFRQCTFC